VVGVAVAGDRAGVAMQADEGEGDGHNRIMLLYERSVRWKWCFSSVP
jgi:hypothetical protein